MKFIVNPANHTSSRRNLFLLVSVLVPVFLYAYLLVTAKIRFGETRILGWDSLVYGFSAQELVSQGIQWLFRFWNNPDVTFWNHPNVYVLLLAAISLPLNNVPLAVNVLPIGLVAALSVASGYLVRRMTSVSTGLVAAILTATSMATFRLFVDLHRALLAFVGVTLLLALDAPRVLSKAKLDREGILALALLFLIAFSEFEIYLAFLAATMVALVLRRNGRRKGALVIAWSLVPGAFLALTPAPWTVLGSIFRAISNPAAGLIEELTPELAFVYLSTIVSIPFMILGFGVLLRNLRTNSQSPSTLLLSWVIMMLVILLILGFIFRRISPFRALILLHGPILVTLGAGYAISKFAEFSRTYRRRLPEGHFLRTIPPRQAERVALVLTVTALVVVSWAGVLQNADSLLRPIVPEEVNARLVQSSIYVKESGWPEPLYLVVNESLIDILTPIRFELGRLNGPSHVYYGDLNLVPWFLPPNLVYPGAMNSKAASHFLFQEYEAIGRSLNPGPLDLLTNPIVIITPELFPREIPDSFQGFLVDEGLYVIPPNSLSLGDFLIWEILAEEDSYNSEQYVIAEWDWSRSGKVMETHSDTASQLSFPYVFPVNGSYTLSVHLFDFPRMQPDSSLPLSPIELAIGDETVSTLVYGGNGAFWWNLTLAEVNSGFEIVTFRPANVELPFSLSLDVIIVSKTP